MDVDLLNYPPESQVDLLTMMMEMEKLPEFSKPPQPPPAEFLAGGPSPAFLNAASAAPPSPVLIGVPSSAPFCGGGATPPAQEPILSPVLPPSSDPVGTPSELSFSTGGLGHRQQDPMAAMREVIFRIAAMQPVHIDPESVRPPKRRNVKISKDPQSVAARHRRERISERIRILQRLVPGGTKMDTASMLDEAIRYMKFLKTQVQCLERVAAGNQNAAGIGAAASASMGFSPVAAGFSPGSNYWCFAEAMEQGFMNPTRC